jgi:hypothetical protein
MELATLQELVSVAHMVQFSDPSSGTVLRVQFHAPPKSIGFCN